MAGVKQKYLIVFLAPWTFLLPVGFIAKHSLVDIILFHCLTCSHHFVKGFCFDFFFHKYSYRSCEDAVTWRAMTSFSTVSGSEGMFLHYKYQENFIHINPYTCQVQSWRLQTCFLSRVPSDMLLSDVVLSLLGLRLLLLPSPVLRRAS